MRSVTSSVCQARPLATCVSSLAQNDSDRDSPNEEFRHCTSEKFLVEVCDFVFCGVEESFGRACKANSKNNKAEP